MVYEPQSGDSLVAVECSGGGPTADLDSVRLYGWPLTGGFGPLQSHSARNREGQPDSFVVDPGPGTTYYATAIDTAGNESCPSNTVFLPGTVTGVNPGPGDDPVVSVRAFDVHGRQVVPHASGIYFEVIRRRSGAVAVKRRVILK